MRVAISARMALRHCKKPRNLPTLWLMTDERIATESLMQALHRLPKGAGVIFRHYSLDAAPRRALFRQVQAVALRRGLVLLLAGPARDARAWGANGWHGRSRGPASLLHSAPAHHLREIRAAERTGADLVLLSPVFPTRSHPGEPALGRVRFAMLTHEARVPVIALGGMGKARWRELKGSKAIGWAAIDAWQTNQPPVL
ncbi:MAG: thiamine phosphate synthase [Sphingobium sp.]